VGGLVGRVADGQQVRPEKTRQAPLVVEGQAGVVRDRVVHPAVLDAAPNAVLESDRRFEVEAVVAGPNVVEADALLVGLGRDVAHTAMEGRVVVGVGPAGGVVVVLRARAIELRRPAAVGVEADVALAVVPADQRVHHAHELPLPLGLEEQVVAPQRRGRVVVEPRAEVARALLGVRLIGPSDLPAEV